MPVDNSRDRKNPFKDPSKEFLSKDPSSAFLKTPDPKKLFVTPGEKFLAGELPPAPLPEGKDSRKVAKIVAGLAAAFIVYRTLMHTSLGDSKPENMQKELDDKWSLNRADWIRIATSAIFSAYALGSKEGLADAALESLAAGYADQLGEYIHSTSSKALVEGVNSQLVSGWGDTVAWQRGKEGYGLDGPQMRSFLTRLITSRASDEVLSNKQIVSEKDKRGVTDMLLRRADLIGESEGWASIQTGKAMSWLFMEKTGELTGKPMKRWITAEDELVCPICAPLHGVTIPIGDRFESKGHKFFSPGVHPNCRCELELIEDMPKTITKADEYDRDWRGRFAETDTRRARPMAIQNLSGVFREKAYESLDEVLQSVTPVAGALALDFATQFEPQTTRAEPVQSPSPTPEKPSSVPILTPRVPVLTPKFPSRVPDLTGGGGGGGGGGMRGVPVLTPPPSTKVPEPEQEAKEKPKVPILIPNLVPNLVPNLTGKVPNLEPKLEPELEGDTKPGPKPGPGPTGPPPPPPLPKTQMWAAISQNAWGMSAGTHELDSDAHLLDSFDAENSQGAETALQNWKDEYMSNIAMANQATAEMQLHANEILKTEQEKLSALDRIFDDYHISEETRYNYAIRYADTFGHVSNNSQMLEAVHSNLEMGRDPIQAIINYIDYNDQDDRIFRDKKIEYSNYISQISYQSTTDYDLHDDLMDDIKMYNTENPNRTVSGNNLDLLSELGQYDDIISMSRNAISDNIAYQKPVMPPVRIVELKDGYKLGKNMNLTGTYYITDPITFMFNNFYSAPGTFTEVFSRGINQELHKELKVEVYRAYPWDFRPPEFD